MFDPAALLAALIRARRSGDRAAVNAALTKLAERSIPILFGDSLPPPRTPKSTGAGASQSDR